MANTTIATGTTRTDRLDVAGNDLLIVEADGALSVSANAQAVRFNAPTNGANITNNGTIEATGDQEEPRAIRFEEGIGSLLVAQITNTGLIRSRDDAIGIKAGTLNAGELTIGNSATITSENGQAIDAANGLGTFVLRLNNSGEVHSSNSDAVRIGGVGVFANFGVINGGSAVGYSGADGIQFEDNSSGTVENSSDGGAISGDRHALNAGVGSSITVTNNGTLTGRNGSGVGSDGTASVTNFGTITGAFSNSAGSDINGPGGGPDGINDGDGDGIDVDGKATIVNHGLIEGTGAGGHGSDGLPNTSEGIAAGGGTFTNHAGAVIRGLGLGILIDDSSQGPAPFKTIISNQGTIEGTNSFGIRIISNTNDLIINNGTITGGGGTAILFGNGEDTLRIGSTSSITGVSNGGGGTNVLDYVNWGAAPGATVNLSTGTASGTGGVINFQNVSGSAGADNFTGNGGANRLLGGAENDQLNGGGGTDTLGGGLGNDTLLGGSGNDTLYGSDGNDSLNGGLNADRMEGGLGDDLYYVNSSADTVVEAASSGTDRVKSAVAFTLYNTAIENLTLTGGADVSATGSIAANIIIGNAGDNAITGGRGADDLHSADGGFDNDRFVYTNTLSSGATAATMDQIFGFDRFNAGTGEANWDKIDLSALNLAAARVKIVDLGADVNVTVNTDGDAAVEMIIQVVGVGTLSFADIIL